MSDERFADREARELWRRAAELQAAAERAEGALLPATERDEPVLSLAELAAVAEAAGIHPDHVRLALAERRLPDAPEIEPHRWAARWLRRLLPAERDVIELHRDLRATPASVLQAVRTVLPAPAFGLALEDSVGDNPLVDGVLVYRMPPDELSGFAGDMNWADARVVLVAIREREGGTRLRMRVPLFRRGINLAFSSGFGAAAGAGGGFAGLAAGGALAALGAAAALAPMALGAAAGVALGVRTYRSLYRWTYRGGEVAMQRLLQAVAVEAEGPVPALPGG